MFLEPVYLNEKMLMNCASYLFKGVSLETQSTSSAIHQNNVEGKAQAGLEAGAQIFQNLAKASSDFNITGDRSHQTNEEYRITKNITLGSLHMNVIETMNEKYLNTVSYKTLTSKPDLGKYVQIKAILKPVEFYSILEILKLILSQSEIFIKSSGKLFFKAENGQNKSLKLLNEKIESYANLTHSLSGLINALELDYLKSNLLEMLMFDETKKIIGVLDIDVKEKNPNEIKAQLTDGEFTIFGKVVRYIDEKNELNLVQRSLLSAITEKINQLVPIISLFQKDNPDFFQNYKDSSILAKDIIEQFIDLKLKGPVIRVKAMSVCM